MVVGLDKVVLQIDVCTVNLLNSRLSDTVSHLCEIYKDGFRVVEVYFYLGIQVLGAIVNTGCRNSGYGHE